MFADYLQRIHNKLRVTNLMRVYACDVLALWAESRVTQPVLDHFSLWAEAGWIKYPFTRGLLGLVFYTVLW